MNKKEEYRFNLSLHFLFAKLLLFFFFLFFIGSMVCNKFFYRRIDCVDGCVLARYFHEENLSTYNKKCQGNLSIIVFLNVKELVCCSARLKIFLCCL